MKNRASRRLFAWTFWITCFPPLPGRPRRARQRQRGSVTVEYVVLLSTVALGLAAAVVGLGVPLVRTYLEQTALLSLPFP